MGSRAGAQTHWDLNVHGGVARRFFNTSLPEGGTLGPTVGLSGDVALLPLIRLGAYADFESAYTGEPATPVIVSFGARVKFDPPVNFKGVHVYAFTGFGAADVQAPGYQQILPAGAAGTTQTTFSAQATSGYLFEIPVGVGAAWRFRRPWELLLELQGRIGFGSSGDYFSPDGRPGTAAGVGSPGAVIGTDVFALMATVGIGLDD